MPPQTPKRSAHLPTNASAVIAAHLRSRIATGELAEGDPLPNETLLMEEYDVSRPTARGAIRILENESLVVVKKGAGGGPRVRIPDIRVVARQFSMHLQLDGTTVRDLFDARALLEPAAVRRLAETRPKRAIARLREIHEQELTLLHRPQEYSLLAATFHEQVVELAGNATLALIERLLGELVENQTRATMQRQARPLHFAKLGYTSHGEVIDLIVKGDAAAAEAHWRTHVEDAARVAVRVLGARTRIDASGTNG